MSTVRLGAVGYLNARPLVYGLDRQPGVSLRFDVPSRCSALLHEGAIDVGLIPSIEYLRGAHYLVVPDLAIASCGPVASVTIFTKKDIADVRSIALDTSSRTSVALVSVLCARAFGIRPELTPAPPDLDAMLATADAALIIGDNALFQSSVGSHQSTVQMIDLGDTWTRLTGLPFVYAFWAGRENALDAGQVQMLRQAKHTGVAATDEIAVSCFPDSPERQSVASRYLRDNIKYDLGPEECAGLELFYRYAAEVGVVPNTAPLEFYR